MKKHQVKSQPLDSCLAKDEAIVSCVAPVPSKNCSGAEYYHITNMLVSYLERKEAKVEKTEHSAAFSINYFDCGGLATITVKLCFYA